MTLIRELISIPEQVFQGDFVLKLADGVTNADETLGNYVVTPQLVDAFSNALGLDPSRSLASLRSLAQARRKQGKVDPRLHPRCKPTDKVGVGIAA